MMKKNSEKNVQKTDVWMPIYIGDYLADTQRLTTEQHGAYLLLLFDYWRNGPLPNDDAVLAQITRLKQSAWRKQRSAIICFFTSQGERLIHCRVEAERVKAGDNQARRTAKAKTAADARWRRDGDAPSNAPSMPDSAPEAMLGACPLPSPLSVSKETGGEPPPDPVKVIYQEGVSLLVGAGSSAASARSLIGKWRKEQGNEKVAAAIADAVRLNITEPRAWIAARFNKAANDADALYASINRTFTGNGGQQ
jgi:uncharacterized protein YdaU (DUF1376 family)